MQSQVDSEFGGWSKIWGRHGAKAGAPWRETQGCRLIWVDAEPRPITGKDLRQAGLKHAEKNGFICAHARWAAWISDELLDDFAVLLNLCEEAGI